MGYGRTYGRLKPCRSRGEISPANVTVPATTGGGKWAIGCGRTRAALVVPAAQRYAVAGKLRAKAAALEWRS